MRSYWIDRIERAELVSEVEWFEALARYYHEQCDVANFLEAVQQLDHARLVLRVHEIKLRQPHGTVK